MNKISTHISYVEATKSYRAIRKGIVNIPSTAEIIRMRYAAKEIFEKPRQHFGVRCNVNSFFRSRELNLDLGSHSPNHPLGIAIDADRDRYMQDKFNGMEVTNKMWFEYIYWNCDFWELIWEYGTKENPEWVHAAAREGKVRKLCKIAEPGKGYRIFDPIAEGYISATKPDYC